MAMVRELPVYDRPRERLIRFGADSLSNAELLALFIRNGSKQKSALDLASEVLNIYRDGGLSAMRNITVNELTAVKGIGNAKAAEIVAAVELGKRLAKQDAQNRIIVSSPEDAAAYAVPRLRFEQKENFALILLNVKNHILAMPVISVGSLTASIVHPREVFKTAVQYSVAAIILVHNHPSGDPSPSREDISITERLVKCSKLMDIPVLDHIIIGDDRFVSLKERGMMS